MDFRLNIRPFFHILQADARANASAAIAQERLVLDGVICPFQIVVLQPCIPFSVGHQPLAEHASDTLTIRCVFSRPERGCAGGVHKNLIPIRIRLKRYTAHCKAHFKALQEIFPHRLEILV